MIKINKARMLAVLSLAVVLSSCAAGEIGESESGKETEKITEVETENEEVKTTEKVTETETEKETESSTEHDEAESEEDYKKITHNGKSWVLTFNDEFDKKKLDLRKWSYMPNWVRDDCVWKRGGVEMRDGYMYMTIEGDEIPYTAGAIRSLGHFEQAYGYYEIRCKLPTVAGVNAAFWLMGGNMGDSSKAGGEDGAEIDIFETHKFSSKQFQHALHWDGYGSNHQSVDKQVKNINIYDGEFHTFALEWNKDEYIFYVDGKETWKTSKGGVCEVPLYLKITLATGAWVGQVDPTALPTVGMVVDYVRVYEEE